jgi:hypothetical protein
MPKKSDRTTGVGVGAGADAPAPPELRTMGLTAIDPGERHTGWCDFAAERDGTARLVWCGEMLPADAALRLEHHLEWQVIEAVVCEGWWLQGDKALELVGSDLPTVRLIGALEWTVQRYNYGQRDRQIQNTNHEARIVSWNLERPDAKRAGYAQAQARGVELPNPHLPDKTHVRDAFIVGCIQLWKLGYRVVTE